jgi:hypothetical protein
VKGIDIYDSLHSRTDVGKSKLATALLLARHAEPDGTVRMSYSYLALLLKCCKRTAIRHVKSLIEESQILIKRPLRWISRKRCDINVYRFVIKFRRNSAHPFSGDIFSKMSSTPIDPEEERKKDLRNVREEIRIQEKMLRFLDPKPGTDLYEQLVATIARLQARLAELTSAQEG